MTFRKRNVELRTCLLRACLNEAKDSSRQKLRTFFFPTRIRKPSKSSWISSLASSSKAIARFKGKKSTWSFRNWKGNRSGRRYSVAFVRTASRADISQLKTIYFQSPIRRRSNWYSGMENTRCIVETRYVNYENSTTLMIAITGKISQQLKGKWSCAKLQISCGDGSSLMESYFSYVSCEEWHEDMHRMKEWLPSTKSLRFSLLKLWFLHQSLGTDHVFLWQRTPQT